MSAAYTSRVLQRTSQSHAKACKPHAGGVVTSRLGNGRAGITKVLQMDISPGMLQRDQAQAQVLPHIYNAVSIKHRVCWIMLYQHRRPEPTAEAASAIGMCCS